MLLHREVSDDSDLPFAICKSCTKAFEFDSDESESYHNFAKNQDGDWVSARIECPYCLKEDEYRLEKETFWPVGQLDGYSKEKDSLKRVNDLLRKKIADEERYGIKPKTEVDPGLPFVICVSCTRAFDVDTWHDKLRNTTKISETLKDGRTTDTQYLAECPHCYDKNQYSEEKDFHWAESGLEKERMMLVAVNDGLRKKLLQATDENTLLEKNLTKANLDRTRLRKENRKLADTIHLLEPEEKEPQKRDKNPLAS